MGDLRQLVLTALPGVPLVEPGDDLATLVLEAVDRAGDRLRDRDVLVVAQKVVSKSEDRYVELADIEPSEQAVQLAAEVDKDRRLVEVILRESNEVVRHREGVLVVEQRSGVVLANAGIDQSNIVHTGELDRVLCLPLDSDASAEALRGALRDRVGVDVAVIINDSLGRAWRNGTVSVALGAAGFPALDDRRGTRDLFDRELRVTEVGLADEIASGASVLQGQGAEACPFVLVRGLEWTASARPARDLVRDKARDLFR